MNHSADQQVVDAHLHVWDLDVSAYAWLGPQHGELHASFPPASAQRALASAGIEHAVLVQAEDSERDTEYLLEVADTHPFAVGVVGWVQLDDPSRAARQLDRWQRHPAFCGVRHLVHDDPRDDFLDLPEVRTSLRMLAERGVPFDVPDAWPRHLVAVERLAADLPQLTVVVDHLGKPPRGRPDFDDWAATLRRVAAHPNTVAKVSGLPVPGQPFTTDALRPTWDHALDAFGPSRLMYGGDWPITVTFGGYRAVWEVVSRLIGELSPDERDHLLSGTAGRVYGVATSTPDGPR